MIFTKKVCILTLIILLVFVVNPLFILNSFAGDEPLTASTDVPLSENNSFWLWNFLGRLHPLAVHFPVSLLLFAAVLEVFTIKNFNSKLRPGINIVLAAGVVTSIISVILGLLLARNGDYGEDTLSLHQWSGVAAAGLGGLSLFFLYRIWKNNQVNLIKPYRAILLLTGIGVCVAGHFGASLTHGNDYLSSTLPWSDDYEAAFVKNLGRTTRYKVNGDTLSLKADQIPLSYWLKSK